MKKIGVTYSPAIDEKWSQIKELVDTVEICNLSQFEKAADNLWTYHFRFRDPYNPKAGSLNLLKLDEIKLALERSKEVIFKKKPEIISVHLAFPALEIGKVPPDNHNVAESPILPREEVLKRVVESLDYLSEFTERVRIPLAIEQLDFHLGGAYEYICEPDFINEVLQGNKNLYLLLDVAHAEISAVELLGERPKNRLVATRKYLKRLLLERVIEIHINSPIWEDGNPLDMHFPITEVEKKLLRNLLFLPNLQIVSLECESEVEKQLKYLRGLTW